MRQTILASTLTAMLALALGGIAAAGQSTQTIDITGPAMFFSILGGNSNGTATLSGDVVGDEVGTLRGTINFALRDESLTVSPTSTLTLTTDLFPVSWQLITCDNYGCYWTYGTAMYERRHAEGPVDLKLGSLKGSGNLSINAYGSCVSSCPPPGAYSYPPTSAANLSGAVTGSKDAGTLSMYAVPIIH